MTKHLNRCGHSKRRGRTQALRRQTLGLLRMRRNHLFGVTGVRALAEDP